MGNATYFMECKEFYHPNKKNGVTVTFKTHKAHMLPARDR